MNFEPPNRSTLENAAELMACAANKAPHANGSGKGNGTGNGKRQCHCHCVANLECSAFNALHSMHCKSCAFRLCIAEASADSKPCVTTGQFVATRLFCCQQGQALWQLRTVRHKLYCKTKRKPTRLYLNQHQTKKPSQANANANANLDQASIQTKPIIPTNPPGFFCFGLTPKPTF